MNNLRYPNIHVLNVLNIIWYNISDVQKCTYNTPIQQGETKLIARMRKEEIIMEGFKYYWEAYAVYGTKLMKVFVEEGVPEELDAKGYEHLWKQIIKKLDEVNRWVSSISLNDREFDRKTELHKKLWDIYAIGVGIVDFLTMKVYTKKEIADWKKKDINMVILECMTEELPRLREIQVLVNTFFNVTEVLNVEGK